MGCMNEHSLQMFVDNELDGAESALVANHLRECAPCSRQIANVVRLKRATHQAGQRFAPSAAFTRKMMGQVSRPKPQRWWTRVMVITPAAALIVLIAVSSFFMIRERSANAGRELADLHVATLASPNPLDVISSDKHTVKPYFAGKVPFTFDVPELQGSEYELLGGRMAYLHQSPAAQLVFKYHQHRVSVFIVQEGALAGDLHAPANFTERHWRANGLSYYLVTDSSPDTVKDLVTRMKAAAATT
jgi:anti-sigma factor RsiW